jgi:hypothetical protein
MGRLEIGAIFSVVSPRAAHSLRLNVVWHAFTYVSNRLVADPTDAAIFPKFANDDFAPLSGREFVSELPENLIPDAAYAWTNLLPLSDGANHGLAFSAAAGSATVVKRARLVSAEFQAHASLSRKASSFSVASVTKYT